MEIWNIHRCWKKEKSYYEKKNSEYCDEHCSFDHFVMELHATLQLHEKILGKKIGAYDNTKSMQKADVRD